MNARALVMLLGAVGCAGLACWSSGDRGRSGTGGSIGGAGGSGGGAGGGAVTCSDGAGGAATGGAGAWVGTWATGPQLTEPGNVPPAPGLGNNTLRQVVFTSIGGQELRLRLSNEFGDGPVTMSAVHVARSTSGSTIDAATDTALSFAGAGCVMIPAGQAVFSDPFAFDLPPLTKIAVTIAFGAAPGGITGHPGSRTTSYLVAGDMVAAASLSGAVPTEHWYYITGIDVAADAATAAVVTLGDSITDGRGSTTDTNNRWPDQLSKRLQANAATMNKVGVLNQGIGGNAVLSGGLGPTAMQRFARDVLQMRGVKWLIIFEGVNDIGGSSNGAATATQLNNAFSSLADMAHAQGIKVYGATITPFNGNGYYSVDHEAARTMVNNFIRTSTKFDAVLDLDMAVRDPADASRLLPAYSMDGLHMTPAGYQRVADSINLALFTN
jgi:lysophospholipase L1-like esterase